MMLIGLGRCVHVAIEQPRTSIMPEFELLQRVRAMLSGAVDWASVNLWGTYSPEKNHKFSQPLPSFVMSLFLIFNRLSHMASYGAKTAKPTKCFGTWLGAQV